MELENLQSAQNDAEDCVENSTIKLKTQCEYLKDEIEISYESVIYELTQIKQSLFDQIDEYETGCQERIDRKDSTELTELKNVIENSKEKQDRDFDEIKKELNDAKKKYNRFIYSDRLLQFKERVKCLDNNVLGKLVYEKYLEPKSRFIIDLDRLRSLKEPQYINIKQQNPQMHTLAAIHRSICVAICDDQFVLCTDEIQPHLFAIGLKIIDTNGVIICENYESNVNLRLVGLNAFDKHIALIAHDLTHAFKLKLYDTSLILLKELNLNYMPARLTLDTTHICVLSHINAPYLYLYDLELSLIPNQIRLTNAVNSEIFVRGEKLYLRDLFHWKFKIFDFITGVLLNEIQLPMIDCLVDVDLASNIILINKMQKKLMILNETNAQVLFERDLSRMHHHNLTNLSCSQNGSVILYDFMLKSLFVF